MADILTLGTTLINPTPPIAPVIPGATQTTKVTSDNVVSVLQAAEAAAGIDPQKVVTIGGISLKMGTLIVLGIAAVVYLKYFRKG